MLCLFRRHNLWGKGCSRSCRGIHRSILGTKHHGGPVHLSKMSVWNLIRYAICDELVSCVIRVFANGFKNHMDRNSNIIETLKAARVFMFFWTVSRNMAGHIAAITYYLAHVQGRRELATRERTVAR